MMRVECVERSSSVRPANELEAADQTVAHFVDGHDVQVPGRQTVDGFLVDGVGGALDPLVDGAAELWILGEALGVDFADLVEAAADQLAGDEIGDRCIIGEECTVTVDIMRVVDNELTVDDIAWGRVLHRADYRWRAPDVQR